MKQEPVDEQLWDWDARSTYYQSKVINGVVEVMYEDMNALWNHVGDQMEERA